MRFRKPQVEELEINLTPMIDCLLFLVIFLLLSTTFNHFSRLNIVLPEAEGVTLKQDPNKVEVAVMADGSYLVNGKKLTSTGESELIAAIKQVTGTDRNRVFIISADAKATHQDVVRAMDVAGKLGFINLNISTVVPK